MVLEPNSSRKGIRVLKTQVTDCTYTHTHTHTYTQYLLRRLTTTYSLMLSFILTGRATDNLRLILHHRVLF